MNTHLIDIQTEFTACVRSLGGVIVDDDAGPSKAPNADFLFTDSDVVAELKILERDTRRDSRFIERVTKLYRGWAKQGIVPHAVGPSATNVTVPSESLPLECQKQLLDLLRNRLLAVIKKANLQIVRTKANQEMPTAKGLLILANDGDPIFEIEVVFHLLQRIIATGRFSSINTVLYFTANMPVQDERLPVPAQVWADLVLEDMRGIRPAVANDLLLRLREAWFNRLASINGAPTLAYDRTGDTPNQIALYRFVPSAEVRDADNDLA